MIFNNDTLTVRLTGRVDSANAVSVGKKILRAIDEHNAEKVIIDAEELKYISNAGMKAILKVKKAKPDLQIVNASCDVYELLDMEGITDIIDTRKILREISVEDCKVIEECEIYTVYRLDRDTIVKIYNRSDLEDIRREMNFAKQAFINGIPTAISFDIVKCGERYGVIFEIVQSDTLVDRLKNDPEHFDEYVEKFAALTKKLHSTELGCGELVSANDVYRQRFAELEGVLTDDEMSELNRLIDSVPERNTMIHGDLYKKNNIMIRDDELLMIGTGELMRGHPIYDICEVYFACTYFLESGKDGELTGSENDISMHFLDKFTAVYFTGSIQEDREKAVNAVKIFGEYRKAYVYLSADDTDLTYEERVKNAADIIKERVLPNIDTIMDAFTLDFIEW